jgi:hypothetical protein
MFFAADWENILQSSRLTIRSPSFHQNPAFVERITSAVCLFGFITDHVR